MCHVRRTGLDAAQLAGTSLVTASALLDLLTADEVDALAAALNGHPQPIAVGPDPAAGPGDDLVLAKD